MSKINFSQKYFLSIAATDTTGEAGITKDCKIASSLGFKTLGVVTAITTQNEQGLHNIYPISDIILQEQLKICSEYPVKCIKIGALGSQENGLLIASLLVLFQDAFIVWDPVFAPSKGRPFIEKEERKTIIDALLPRVDIATPNYLESLVFTAQKKSDRLKILQQIAIKNKCSFYITGGHDQKKGRYLNEYYIDWERIISLKKEKKVYKYQHGTGCTFSTALACYMGNNNEIIEASKLSNKVVDTLYGE